MGIGSETVINFVALCGEIHWKLHNSGVFALNKITCFNFGRGWRKKDCGETFFLTGSSKERYSSRSEHSGFNTDQQGV